MSFTDLLQPWVLLGLIAASALAYSVLAIRFGVYQRFPAVHYAVMIVAGALLLKLLFEQFVLFRLLATIAGFALLGGFVWFTVFASSYPTRDLGVAIGDSLAERLDSLALANAEGREIGIADAIAGARATLLVFYRGWW